MSYVSKSPTYVDDPQYGKFEIKTYSGSGGGSMSIRRATIASDNSAYIQLAMDLGPDQVKQTARDMGIRSKLNGYPAETLGGLENGVSPLEMATAYATLASGGYRNRPTAIKRIVFPDGHAEQGKSLPKRFRVKRTKVFTDGVAAKATEILQQNMTGGTGVARPDRLPGRRQDRARRTTTRTPGSSASRPRLSTAVWVGYPDSRIYMNSLFFGGPVDGGTYPAIIWGQYMQQRRARAAATPSRCPRSRSSPARSSASTPTRAAPRSAGPSPSPPSRARRRPRRTTTDDEETTEEHGDDAGGHAPEPAAEPDAPESGGFDPTQYEAAPDGRGGPATPPRDGWPGARHALV